MWVARRIARQLSINVGRVRTRSSPGLSSPQDMPQVVYERPAPNGNSGVPAGRHVQFVQNPRNDQSVHEFVISKSYPMVHNEWMQQAASALHRGVCYRQPVRCTEAWLTSVEHVRAARRYGQAHLGQGYLVYIVWWVHRGGKLARWIVATKQDICKGNASHLAACEHDVCSTCSTNSQRQWFGRVICVKDSRCCEWERGEPNTESNNITWLCSVLLTIVSRDNRCSLIFDRAE